MRLSVVFTSETSAAVSESKASSRFFSCSHYFERIFDGPGHHQIPESKASVFVSYWLYFEKPFSDGAVHHHHNHYHHHLRLHPPPPRHRRLLLSPIFPDGTVKDTLPDIDCADE